MDNFNKFQLEMMKKGKIKIPNFREIVKKYFQSKYNKNGYFEFLYVEYQFYDKDYQIYNVDLGQYVSRPENRKVKTMLPFFIEPDAIDDIRKFNLVIPGIIDIDQLDKEISSNLPNGVTMITENDFHEILFLEGYEDLSFQHYFFSMMEYPNFYAYARPLQKNSTHEIIDIGNIQANVVDAETSKILEDLYSKNQLLLRKIWNRSVPTCTEEMGKKRSR